MKLSERLLNYQLIKDVNSNDRFFRIGSTELLHVVIELEEENQQLRDKIEKMRNCQNCKYYTSAMCATCKHAFPENRISHWKLKND
jgi:hypothetical protein